MWCLFKTGVWVIITLQANRCGVSDVMYYLYAFAGIFEPESIAIEYVLV